MLVFELNVLDDKKNSWCAPSDCTGKVFVKIRELNSDHQDTSELTYDDTEHFLRFLDKYVSRAVGNHTFARWKKMHQTKTLLDKISALDIAYTFLVGVAHQGSCKNGPGKEKCKTTIIPGIAREEVNA